MKYTGSKNRIAKYIVPIIQKYVDNPNCKGYVEPFCGGCAIIEKINHKNRYAFDNHKYLIALLKQAQKDCSVFPETYQNDFYDKVKNNKNEYEDWLVGLVGFSSFGAKWFGGFPRGFKEDKVTPRDIVNESIRNIKKQAPKLKDIKFMCRDFRTINPSNLKNYVIYCDPPYKNSTKYSTGEFPYEEFYNWCRELSKNNVVLVSEYNMPDDFECIWCKEITTSLDCNRGTNNDKINRVEKLFIIRKDN